MVPLHRTGNGSGVDHVLTGIAPTIDTGEQKIGRLILHQVARPHDDAIRGSAFDREAAVFDRAQAQWIIQRQ